MRRGALRGNRSTGIGGVVPLPKLPETQRRTCLGLRGIYGHGLFRYKGEITKFNSSPGRWRGFCSRCGSTLTCEGERLPAETHFHIGAFEQAARLEPKRPIFPEE